MVLSLLLALTLIGAGINPRSLNPQIWTIFEVVFQALTTVGLLWLFMRLGRFDMRATLRLRSCRPSIYLWALASAISLSVVVSQLLTYLFQAAPWLLSDILLELVRGSRPDDPTIYALFALAVSLAPGLTEELAFRGFILRGLSARLGSVGTVLLTAFLFAVVHIDPLWSLSAFPFGVFAGYLVVRTGSLYPAIVAHWFNNLWATLEWSLWQAANPQMSPAEILLSTGYPLWAYVIAGAVLIIALYNFHRAARASS